MTNITIVSLFADKWQGIDWSIKGVFGRTSAGA